MKKFVTLFVLIAAVSSSQVYGRVGAFSDNPMVRAGGSKNPQYCVSVKDLIQIYEGEIGDIKATIDYSIPFTCSLDPKEDKFIFRAGTRKRDDKRSPAILYSGLPEAKSVGDLLNYRNGEVCLMAQKSEELKELVGVAWVLRPEVGSPIIVEESKGGFPTVERQFWLQSTWRQRPESRQ